MSERIQHPGEERSNAFRGLVYDFEPRSLRTYTPTQAVIAKSAGIYHFTPEGRRLYDFTSGVLVTNLGHNPRSWLERFARYMRWPALPASAPADYISALPLNAYNAVTEVEADVARRLVALLCDRPGGGRLAQVLWAASGSEAIQKALAAALARDRSRDIVLATRHGFHGKKGLAGAVSGCETDADRDPRVRFISFPRDECLDVTRRGAPFDPAPYRRELESLARAFGRRLTALITEPYLGAAGSYHPPPAYLQLLQAFCREHDLVFVLDEVQANFGRTGTLFAFETYGLEPDVLVLGKSLGNGVPVAALVGRGDVLAGPGFGEGSDTYSGNPLAAAAVAATLDEFESRDMLGPARRSSALIEAGLLRIKEVPFVAHVRGEAGGMVWGVEMREHAGKTAAAWANDCVLACYKGEGGATGDGIHLLGPLAKNVIRIAPPLVIHEEEAQEAMHLMERLLSALVPRPARAGRA
jgi:4-aminobutyrate aminotransferase-like enzyme